MDVSKSEKKRVRVRHRNKGNSAGSSIRSRNRVRKTLDDADVNADNSEKSVDNGFSGDSIDGNNNNSNHVANRCPIDDHQMETNLNDSAIPNLTVDSLDNASNSDTGSMDSGLSNTYESPAIVINEDQLIKTSNLVENCALNFDSIMNADNGTGIFTNLNVDEVS